METNIAEKIDFKKIFIFLIGFLLGSLLPLNYFYTLVNPFLLLMSVVFLVLLRKKQDYKTTLIKLFMWGVLIPSVLLFGLWVLAKNTPKATYDEVIFPTINSSSDIRR